MSDKFREAYEPPFTCDVDAANVMDKNGNIIVTVRGWSRLSELFEHDDAFELQLEIGRFIAKALTNEQTSTDL